jgi:hypothetical protein
MAIDFQVGMMKRFWIWMVMIAGDSQQGECA